MTFRKHDGRVLVGKPQIRSGHATNSNEEADMLGPVAPKKNLPIGVELGAGVARLVQLRGTTDGLELSAYGEIDIAPELRGDQEKRLAFLSQQLASVLKSDGFKGRKCILALPNEVCFVRHVKVHPTEARSLEASVRRVAQDELPNPIQNTVLRHMVAGDVTLNGETWKEVILVAIPSASMDAYLHMARRAGLEVVGINVEPVALVECFTVLFGLDQPDDQAVLYLDLDRDSIQVVISRGRGVVFARNLSWGAHQWEAALARDLEASLEHMRQPASASSDDEPSAGGWLDAACDEIDKCLRYYEYTFQGGSVRRLVLTGEKAQNARLIRLMAERLNLPAYLGDPLPGLQGAGRFGQPGQNGYQPQPAMAVGIGLSLIGRDM
jgi:type IV pilus assembly protein PilM